MKVRIDSSGRNLIIKTSNSIYEAIRNNAFLKEYISNVSIDAANKYKKSSLCIKESSKFGFKTNKILTTLSEQNIRDAIVTINFYLERVRQKNREYTIHGNAVCLGKNAVILVGGMSGIGKTSIAMKLKELNSSAQITDEKFIINGADQTINGGCNFSHDNQKVKYKNIADIENLICNTKLKLIVFPIVTNEQGLTVFNLNELDCFWHLYAAASKDIRGISILIDNFTYNMPSLDNELISKQRIIDIKNIAKNVRAYHIRGNLESVCNFIQRGIS